ncbi:hypothetical protein HX065_05630 [Myroides odoratimimus]|uniref:hypothetical protein n=1 Tax=Myroides odoratimimus TaxID=76832 RepID=UPI0025768B90|nr:hypothetical protein [Myroides odoratimimus]MDM1459524.1 hypothetical protein [Myroides odoratimimus]
MNGNKKLFIILYLLLAFVSVGFGVNKKKYFTNVDTQRTVFFQDTIKQHITLSKEITSEEVDLLLDRYENYLMKFVEYSKQIKNGDMNAINQFLFLDEEEGNKLRNEMSLVEGKMNVYQIERLTKMSDRIMTSPSLESIEIAEPPLIITMSSEEIDLLLNDYEKYAVEFIDYVNNRSKDDVGNNDELIAILDKGSTLFNKIYPVIDIMTDKQLNRLEKIISDVKPISMSLL